MVEIPTLQNTTKHTSNSDWLLEIAAITTHNHKIVADLVAVGSSVAVVQMLECFVSVRKAMGSIHGLAAALISSPVT